MVGCSRFDSYRSFNVPRRQRFATRRPCLGHLEGSYIPGATRRPRLRHDAYGDDVGARSRVARRTVDAGREIGVSSGGPSCRQAGRRGRRRAQMIFSAGDCLLAAYACVRCVLKEVDVGDARGRRSEHGRQRRDVHGVSLVSL